MQPKTDFTFLQAFFRLNSGISRIPPFWYWFIQGLVVLNGIIPLFFLRQPVARWVLGSFVVGVLLMTWLTQRFDFSRILGLAHIAWIPGYLMTWQTVGQYPAGSAIGLWVLLVINTITLLFDAWDVIRWVRGERAVHAKDLDEPLVFREEIEIDRPPAAVWEILSDYASYKDWNPLVQSVTGETDKLDGRIQVKVTPLPFKLNATLDLLEHEKAVGWTDDFPLGALTARPVSRLIDNGNGTTKFLFQETFAGAALPLLAGNLSKQLPALYQELCSALKSRAES